MRAFGAFMSRMSGFRCTSCGAVLRYFPLLGTAEGGFGGQNAGVVACDVCGAGMCLVEHRGWWSPFRLVIGILPELVLAFAVLSILRWLMDVTVVPDVGVVLLVLGKAALFLPVGMAVAVLENRANHRVSAVAPLYGERGRENREDVT